MCGLHFEDKMFLNDLKNRLQPNASPTLFLNNSVVLQYKSAENIMTSSPSLLGKINKVHKLTFYLFKKIYFFSLIILLWAFLWLFKHIIFH